MTPAMIERARPAFSDASISVMFGRSRSRNRRRTAATSASAAVVLALSLIHIYERPFVRRHHAERGDHHLVVLMGPELIGEEYKPFRQSARQPNTLPVRERGRLVHADRERGHMGPGGT